jgi:cytochrome c biogenesis protein
VGVGAVENVGDNSSLSLKLISFKDEYYPEGSPKDFRSEVVVYENGKQVKQGTIQVNHPLSYKSYSFFQSSFGRSVQVQIKGASGQIILNGNIPLTEPLQVETLQLNTGGVAIPGTGMEVWAMQAVTGGGGGMLNPGELIIQLIDQSTQKVIKMSKVSKGVPISTNGLEISYLGDSQFSGFQVVRDPGVNFIWAASILILAGLVMVFYFPLKQLWAVAVPGEPKVSRVLLRTTASRMFNASADLENLVKKIGPPRN